MERLLLGSSAVDIPLNFYCRFARLPWPKSYLGKFLLVAFIGVHVPLISLVSYIALSRAGSWSAAVPTLLVALVATLAGTGATLLVQSWLLAPLINTAHALEAYRLTRKLPELPTDYGDEAGLLMANAQACIMQLEALLTMKRDLLAVISHDTRNPLSQMLTASQLIDLLLDKSPLNVASIKKMNTLIQSGGERQLKLMDGLMLLARSEREAIAVSQDETTIADLLATTLEAARLQADSKGIRLQLDDHTTSDEAAPACLLLDLAKTSQVLNNLMHNALKFTPTGGTVTLSATRDHADQTAASLVLAVQDTGIGMDETMCQTQFTPFTKTGRPGTGGETSSGLGLWICKTFVEAQGGQLAVQSEVGTGSRFSVRLPWRTVPLRSPQKPSSTLSEFLTVNQRTEEDSLVLLR